jgi:hypothetical protein
MNQDLDLGHLDLEHLDLEHLGLGHLDLVIQVKVQTQTTQQRN